MKNVLLVLFALVAALEAAFLVRQARELAVLRDTTAGQADALAAIEKRLAEKPVKTAAAPAPAAVRAPTEPAPVRFTAPTEQEVVESAAATERKKPDLGKLMAGIGSMMTNPAMKEMMRSQARMQMDMRYGRLFKFFELSPEDTEKLKTLLMDRQMAMMDSGMAFMDRNLTDEQRTARTKEMADRKKSYDDQLKALLGAEDYESLTQFEATEPERMQVDMFKHNLTGDDALTEQRLTEIRERILKGEDFAAIASVTSEDQGSASQGGDLGWASPGTFVLEFEQVLAALQENRRALGAERDPEAHRRATTRLTRGHQAPLFG